MSYNRNAAHEYSKLNVQTSVESASPHRLIEMLLQGALEKIGCATRAMKAGDIATKGANISWAISIIDGLRASLDVTRGGEIAGNLDNLYEYAVRSLAQANLENDADKLAHVASLLREIESAWSAISDQAGGADRVIENRALSTNAVAVG